ncbi:MAG: hypothetical protein QXI51_05455 [Candidatus Korarchaeum sp.]
MLSQGIFLNKYFPEDRLMRPSLVELYRPRSWLISKFAEKYGFGMDDETLSTVHSIEFYNSLCGIRKETPDKNEIGMRVIVGNECLIGDIGEFRKLNGSSIFAVPAEVEDIME